LSLAGIQEKLTKDKHSSYVDKSYETLKKFCRC
jgi:hypothetical protein